MPSLIDLRRRVRSVKNMQQVTKAMKMVAAAKLRRAQDRVIAARPYSLIFREMLAEVAAAAAADERFGSHPLLASRPEQRILLLLMTADRGLAGAFNSNLNRGAQEFFQQHSGEDVRLWAAGRKGRDFWRKRRANIAAERLGISQNAVYSDAAEIAQDITGRFCGEEIDAVYVLYNEFKSIMSQKVTLSRLLPVAMPQQAQPPNYIFEQPPDELLRTLLPRYLEIEIYHAMLESAAAEHAARMTAMESATSNAGDMIDKLTLYMNRVRQASITKELIEVVSGAAAQQ